MNTTATQESVRPAHLPGRWIVICIGITKLLHGCLMILAAVAALAFKSDKFNDIVFNWANDLDVGPYRRHAGEWVSHYILGLSDRALTFAAIGAAMYATLFFTEGMGLLFNKLWAEWVAVISTGGLIPLEIVEIWRKRGILMTLTFAGNVAIVIYLALRVRKRIRWHHEQMRLLKPIETPPAPPPQDAGSCAPDR